MLMQHGKCSRPTVSCLQGPLQDANGHSFRPSRASRESSGTLPDFSRPRSPERPRSSGLSDKDSAHRRSSSKAGAGKRNGMRITIRVRTALSCVRCVGSCRALCWERPDDQPG